MRLSWAEEGRLAERRAGWFAGWLAAKAGRCCVWRGVARPPASDARRRGSSQKGRRGGGLGDRSPSQTPAGCTGS